MVGGAIMQIHILSVGCMAPCLGLSTFVILLTKSFLYHLRVMVLAWALGSIHSEHLDALFCYKL